VRTWKPGNRQTKLSHVRGGQGGSNHSALLRAPRNSSALLSITDRKPTVRNTSKGQMYRAKVWFKPSGGALKRGLLGARITVEERSRKGRHVGSWRHLRMGSEHWRSVTVFITARGDGHRLEVKLTTGRVPSSAAVRVDNVTVHKVASPRVPDEQLRGTRFGASVDEVSNDWVKALHNADERYTRLDAVRVYDPDLPASWEGRLGAVKRPLVHSFSLRPTAVLAGIYDRDLRRWFRQAPTRWPLWWTYIHEPEDNIEHGAFNATKYRAAWQHIHDIEKSVDNANLRPTLILMCWTLSPSSKRKFSDYYPGGFIQVLGWDCYNTSTKPTKYKDPADIFGRAAAKSKALGKSFAIAEFGSRLLPGDDGSRRARWLADIARYAGTNSAAYVTYWDAVIPAGNFKLRDMPSVRSWRSIVSAN